MYGRVARRVVAEFSWAFLCRLAHTSPAHAQPTLPRLPLSRLPSLPPSGADSEWRRRRRRRRRRPTSIKFPANLHLLSPPPPPPRHPKNVRNNGGGGCMSGRWVCGVTGVHAGRRRTCARARDEWCTRRPAVCSVTEKKK